VSRRLEPACAFALDVQNRFDDDTPVNIDSNRSNIARSLAPISILPARRAVGGVRVNS
jgi:hypothetical protein